MTWTGPPAVLWVLVISGAVFLVIAAVTALVLMGALAAAGLRHVRKRR